LYTQIDPDKFPTGHSAMHGSVLDDIEFDGSP
jgi:hypothetical protein